MTPIIGQLSLGDAALSSSERLEDDAFVAIVEAHASSLRGVLLRCDDIQRGARERDLADAVGLDRSIVGRMLRAARSDTDLEFVHQLPSADGLRLFFGAAESAGLIDPPAAAAASEAIDAFEHFLDSYPGKRRAFGIRLASLLPKEREQADRAARRAMFRAASELLGYRMKWAALAMLVVDGDDPIRFDTYHIFCKFGLERIRSGGAPIVVGSHRTGPDGPARGFVPLDEEADRTDPQSAVLLDHCSGPATVQFVRTSKGDTELHLAADEPAVHEPIDIVCGQRAPAILLRQARDDYSHEWRRVVTRIPAERVTVDFIFGPGVFEGAALEVSEHLYRSEVPARPDGNKLVADQFRRAAAVADLGRGSDALSIHGQPAFLGALHDLTSFAGVDPLQCRSVRVSKTFPQINSDLMCWIPLPRAAEAQPPAADG